MIITGKKFSKPDMSRVINGDTILSDGPEKVEKFRLDHLLVEKYKSYNRASLQKFIKLGYVTVDGKVAKKANEKYEKYIRWGMITDPVVYQLRDGTYAEYRSYLVSQGRALNQIKPVTVINTPEKKDFFFSHIK